MDDYYEMMGVMANASDEEIRERYRFLVFAYHPDRFHTHKQKEWAEEELKKINQAYRILGSPANRAIYDRDRGKSSYIPAPHASQYYRAQSPNPDHHRWNKTIQQFAKVLLLGLEIAVLLQLIDFVAGQWRIKAIGPDPAVASWEQDAVFPQSTPNQTEQVVIPVTGHPTEILPPGCFPSDSVTLQDAGKTICVMGTVIGAYSTNEVFYVVLSNEVNSFYFLSYGKTWWEGLRGECVYSEGEIQTLGTSPVMVVQDFRRCSGGESFPIRK